MKLSVPEITFIIAHHDCPDFLMICLESIRRFTTKRFQIWVGDNDSTPENKSAAHQLLQHGDRFFSFPRPYHHPAILQSLFSQADTRFVCILDQDCLILTGEWQKFFVELQPEHRLLAGARDLCVIRKSPEMVHASFMLIDKSRVVQRLHGDLFDGESPDFKDFSVSQPEPYHLLACKALRYHGDSIIYLESAQVDADKYGFGTFWCRGNQPVAYHQWYSGRTSRMNPGKQIDGYNVDQLEKAKKRFIDDYRNGRFIIPKVCNT